MPPGADMTGVQKSGSVWRGILWFFVGLLLGAILALGGGYFALRGGLLQGWLQQYFVSLSSQQYAQVATTTPQAPPLQTFTTASTTIGVPKAYATQEYYTALNSVYFDYNNLIAVGGQMSPLFAKLNAQTVSGNYAGAVNLAVQIKLLITNEQDITTSLGQHLAALSVANQSSKDVITKSLTQDLISSGNRFRDDLTPYFSALDGLFSGQAPSDSAIAQVSALAKTTTDDTLVFKAKFQLLSDHFKAAVKTQQ